MISDVLPSDAFPDLCSPEDHSQSNTVQGNVSLEEQQQQQMSRASYSLTPVCMLLYDFRLAHHRKNTANKSNGYV